MFIGRIEKQIVEEKIKELLEHSYVFNFESFREVVKLLENIKFLKKENIYKEIFLVDLILIEWLKIKYPLVFELFIRNIFLFADNDDTKILGLKKYFQNNNFRYEISENILSKKTVGSLGEEYLEAYWKDFFERIWVIINKNIFDFEVVVNIFLYLVNQTTGMRSGYLLDGLVRIINKVEGVSNIETNYWIQNFYPAGYFRPIDDKNFYFYDNHFDYNLIKFKRFCRLHNIEMYLGFRDSLFKFNDFYRWEDIYDIFEKFNKDFDGFKKAIVNYYIINILSVKGEGLIREELIDEILLKILAFYSEEYLYKVKDIYLSLKREVEDNKEIDENNKKNIINVIDNILKNINEEPESYFQILKRT